MDLFRSISITALLSVVNPVDNPGLYADVLRPVPAPDWMELVRMDYPDDLYLMEDRKSEKQKEERYFIIADLNRAARRAGA